MKLIKYALLMVIGLTACQPKGSYLYQFPQTANISINEVVVIIDYLNLRDDLGKNWDFDSAHHRLILNQLLNQINHKLRQDGYPKVKQYLLSSGLLIKAPMTVDHYVDGELQQQPLYPPFIIASTLADTKQIELHQEIMTILAKYITPRTHHMNDAMTHRGMQMGHHFEAIDLTDDTALLYVQIDLSAPGTVKQLTTFLVSGAIASQTDYGHVQMHNSSNRASSAALIHKGTGQILWKNYSSTWQPSKPINWLLVDFPRR